MLAEIIEIFSTCTISFSDCEHIRVDVIKWLTKDQGYVPKIKLFVDIRDQTCTMVKNRRVIANRPQKT